MGVKVVSQQVVNGCRDLQNRLDELLGEVQELCGADMACLTCIDLDAEYPHNCRSHLGGTPAQMARSTLEFLQTSHLRMACILVLGEHKITVEKCPEGYQVTQARVLSPLPDAVAKAKITAVSELLLDRTSRAK